MEREELEEIHYITLITNVPSICELGILSHNGVARVPHESSLAMQELQDRRHPVRVPPGRPLHDFVNMYICARNPMLYKRLGKHKSICVLRISPEVLDLPGAVVTAVNAGSGYVRFYAAPGGLANIDRELVFARSWQDSDIWEYWRKKRAKCAEVLVPDSVDASYIEGAYVSCKEARIKFEALSTGLDVEVNRDMFFDVA